MLKFGQWYFNPQFIIDGSSLGIGASIYWNDNDFAKYLGCSLTVANMGLFLVLGYNKNTRDEVE